MSSKKCTSFIYEKRKRHKQNRIQGIIFKKGIELRYTPHTPWWNLRLLNIYIFENSRKVLNSRRKQNTSSNQELLYKLTKTGEYNDVQSTVFYRNIIQCLQPNFARIKINNVNSSEYAIVVFEQLIKFLDVFLEYAFKNKLKFTINRKYK